jgi:hypothetical protein
MLLGCRIHTCGTGPAPLPQSLDRILACRIGPRSRSMTEPLSLPRGQRLCFWLGAHVKARSFDLHQIAPAVRCWTRDRRRRTPTSPPPQLEVLAAPLFHHISRGQWRSRCFPPEAAALSSGIWAGDMRLVLAVRMIVCGTAVAAQVNDPEDEKREIIHHAISECLSIGLSPSDALWRQCLRTTVSRQMDQRSNSRPSTSR